MAVRPLKSFFPTADELLATNLPLLGEVLLVHLNSYENRVKQHGGLNRGYLRAMLENRNAGLGSLPPTPEYGDRQPEVTRRMMEAWNWLEREGMLMHNPDQPHPDWFVITSEGEKLLSNFGGVTKLAPHAVAQMLPQEVLHPRIGDKAWSAFMRGDFGDAVFQAMKAIEVSVRNDGGFGNDLVGVPLMRQAFAPNNGPLADTAAERGEQVARMELFAGALGSYKNPHSHRDVDLNDPMEAAEIILLANHLLRIVDARAKARAGTP